MIKFYYQFASNEFILIQLHFYSKNLNYLFPLRFVNVELHGVTPRYGASNSATILLENPVGKNLLDVNSLTKEVSFM